MRWKLYFFDVIAHLQQPVQSGRDTGQFNPVIGPWAWLSLLSETSHTSTATKRFTTAHSDAAKSSLTTKHYCKCSHLVYISLHLLNNTTLLLWRGEHLCFDKSAGPAWTMTSPYSGAHCMDPLVLCFQQRHHQCLRLRYLLFAGVSSPASASILSYSQLVYCDLLTFL